MVQTHQSQDVTRASRLSQSYLLAEPVRRNLFLTLLDQRLHSPEPPDGQYWWATDGDAVVGFALQSPIGFKALLSAETPEVVDSLAQTMYRTNREIPAITGEAWAAARFAGMWTELGAGGAEPFEGERLYQLSGPVQPPDVPGSVRQAAPVDGPTVADWHVGFCSDVGVEPFPDPLATMSARIEEQRLWVWDNDGIVAMAAATNPIAGASRIAHVYTPPAERGNGYGAAITAAVTNQVLSAGTDHCLLYTQLANATSNSIYRRIGYRPIEERLTYRLH